MRAWHTAWSRSSVTCTSVRWVTTLTRTMTSNGPPVCASTSGSDDVAAQEAQPVTAVPLASGLDGVRGDVDPDAVRRLERCQQVAGAAADVEDPQPGRHPHSQDPGQIIVEIAVAPPRPQQPAVMALVELADLGEDRVVAAHRHRLIVGTH